MTDVLNRADLSRTVSHRAFVAVVGFALGVLATFGVLAVVADDDSRIDVGETFEADVVSYFDDSGPEPNVICFDREDGNCGLPLFSSEEPPPIRSGDRVRATEVWLVDDEGVARLAFFVEPLD